MRLQNSADLPINCYSLAATTRASLFLFEMLCSLMRCFMMS